MRKFGFTLAEVLITIGIIGVVSILVISPLVNNYKKSVTINGLKKMYNTFTNVLQKAEVDNGSISEWKFSSSDEFSRKYMEPYFEGVTKNVKYDMYNPAKGKIINVGAQGPAHICIKNGMCYWMYTHDIDKFINNTGGYFLIFADMNGKKGPNMLNKDIFTFSILLSDKKITPNGMGSSRSSLLGRCTKNNSDTFHTGKSCAALIITDGWQIKDDYPW